MSTREPEQTNGKRMDTRIIIGNARPLYDEIAEIDRKLALNRQERNALLDEKRAVTGELADCTIEFRGEADV